MTKPDKSFCNEGRINRRKLLQSGIALFATPWPLLQIGCSPNHDNRAGSTNELSGAQSAEAEKNPRNTMQIHYLEIVTPEVEASVALYSKIYGVSFGVADGSLGGARTAKLANGGTLGIRAPLRSTETPVVRPYFLVGNIDEAVATAALSGAVIAMQPTEIPGRGKFAILIQGGIESGVWQA
jgi:predicted enzyme related to lactoylglutathione lyase